MQIFYTKTTAYMRNRNKKTVNIPFLFTCAPKQFFICQILPNFAIRHLISSTFVRFPLILQPCTFFSTEFSFLLSTAA